MASRRTQKEIRQQAPLWFLGLLVFNVVLMSLDAARNPATKQHFLRIWGGVIAAPLQYVSSSVGGTGVGFFQRIYELRGAAAENGELKQKVDALETELRQTRTARDENDRLKGLLELKEQSDFSPVVGKVIARDPSIWFDTVTIDVGRGSGVELNMPVVTPGGIVGRVVATSPWTSQVMLITDEKAAAGAIVGQLGQSNALGSVKGLGTNGLVEMRYVSGLEKVEPGDYVLTTGQDGIYPPGLSVGTVVEVKQGTASAPHVIYIKPSARLDTLQQVAVLQYKPPQRVAPDQALPNVDKGKK
jgi:rod shape-determining protein MreC